MIKISEAVKSDYDKLEEITQELIKEGGTLKLSFYKILSILSKRAIAEIKVFSVFNDKEPIGFATCYKTGNSVQISHIAFRKDMQSRGLGTQLLNFIANETNASELTAHVSYSNKISEHFFRKNGFSFFNEDYKNRWFVKKSI